MNFTGTSVGHRGHSEVTSDARQALHAHANISDAPGTPSEFAFDLPAHLQSFRAPDRPTSAPAIVGIDECENQSSPMPVHPDRTERLRELKRQANETHLHQKHVSLGLMKGGI